LWCRNSVEQAFLNVDGQTRLLELLEKQAQVSQMLASEQLATIMLFK
jgi:4-hydroxy-L-threonine phosphate dehydrogenase PdxA